MVDTRDDPSNTPSSLQPTDGGAHVDHPQTVLEVAASEVTSPGRPFRYGILDTETSGLPDNDLPADHPTQPRLAHLAMVYVDTDLEVQATHDIYVKPEGWRMQPGATAVNGLTDDFLAEHGAPIGEVLDRYQEMILGGYIAVAFNAQFDCKVMRGELRRAGRDDLFERTANICVMRPLVGICRIPQKNGRGFKWPKLDEACAHFKIPYRRKHMAPDDAMAAFEIMKWLLKIGRCPEPEVHHHAHHDEIVARGRDTTEVLRQVAAEASASRGPSYKVVE